MALTEHYYTQFEAGKFYHVYNRTVDLKPMFRTNSNYIFFLKKYNEYLSDVVDTYAYCLLGNHFHLAIKIKSQEELDIFQSTRDYKNIPDNHEIVSHQFRKFFQSYSMAFNKSFERVGTLFQTPFKRALIDNPVYLKRLIYYIHYNPQHHNLVDDFRDWEWSSFERFLIERPSKLKKEDVFNCFDGRNGFLEYHDLKHSDNFPEPVFIDDIY
ncbi:hypothetical protein F0919_01125 [Taibaiella lutea]|uniref:Transposase IS200-like domain-containing protein n=1 Tax=Taibaiella lutea TaxID=2608001 RepID=A0A5M6CT16_9BACT|nr:hypothetical protein [Taibaiella lutea]KAA5536299.1 hypothetical protein F0919_01125 [Taibaiella lutea]